MSMPSSLSTASFICATTKGCKSRGSHSTQAASTRPKGKVGSTGRRGSWGSRGRKGSRVHRRIVGDSSSDSRCKRIAEIAGIEEVAGMKKQ